MTKPGKRRWFRWVAVLAFLAEAVVALGLYGGDFLAPPRVQIVRHRPLRYDQAFAPVTAQADRLIVRNGGFHGPPEWEDNVLFSVTNKTELSDVVAHLVFQPRVVTNSFEETCLCSGNLRMDWYRGRRLLARTAVMHGQGLRWAGFSTGRILGIRCGYGDGRWTRESKTWMQEWFVKHVPGQKAPDAPASLSAARTPEELGRRVATAFRTGDTEGMEELLPPFEAAWPRLCPKYGVSTTTDEEWTKLRVADKIEGILEFAARFPETFERWTTNRMDQVVAVEVERESWTSNENFADVDLAFCTSTAQYVLVLGDCFRWNGRWYMLDLYWMGRKE